MKIEGVVQRGKKYGSTLGYPTANISLSSPLDPGIYAAQVLLDDKSYFAAVFIDAQRSILEAHILDFSADIYGKVLKVTLEKKIRETRHFNTESELKEVIALDVEAVRDFFKSL